MSQGKHSTVSSGEEPDFGGPDARTGATWVSPAERGICSSFLPAKTVPALVAGGAGVGGGAEDVCDRRCIELIENVFPLPAGKIVLT